MEGIRNHTEEVDGRLRVYCIVCGDPEGKDAEYLDEDGNVIRTEPRPPTGYAEATRIESLGWIKVGDALCCGPRHAAEYADEDVDEAVALAVQPQVFTEEQVAAMTTVVETEDFDPDRLDDFDAWVGTARENGNNQEDEGPGGASLPE